MTALRRLARLFSIVAVAAPLAFALPHVAHADNEKDAETHWNNGVSLYKEGDYPSSLTEFKRAYELTPNYNFLYNIGQVDWQLKDYASALKVYQQYLNDGGARVGASRRSDVEKDIETAKGRIATITVNVSVPGAEVFVDDASVGTAPLKDPVIVNAGKHKFAAQKDGFNPARDQKEFAGGDTGSMTLTLVELKPGETPTPILITPPQGHDTTPPVVTPKVDPPSPSPVGPVILFCLTGGFGIAWGVSGGLALGADSSLTTLKTTKTTKEDLQNQADKAKTLAVVSDVMMGATIVAAGAATIVTIVTFSGGASAKTDEKASTSKVEVKAGPGSLVIDGTF